MSDGHGGGDVDSGDTDSVDGHYVGSDDVDGDGIDGDGCDDCRNDNDGHNVIHGQVVVVLTMVLMIVW